MEAKLLKILFYFILLHVIVLIVTTQRSAQRHDGQFKSAKFFTLGGKMLTIGTEDCYAIYHMWGNSFDSGQLFTAIVDGLISHCSYHVLKKSNCRQFQGSQMWWDGMKIVVGSLSFTIIQSPTPSTINYFVFQPLSLR